MIYSSSLLFLYRDVFQIVQLVEVSTKQLVIAEHSMLVYKTSMLIIQRSNG